MRPAVWTADPQGDEKRAVAPGPHRRRAMHDRPGMIAQHALSLAAKRLSGRAKTRGADRDGPPRVGFMLSAGAPARHHFCA
ncbi:hypothetical protein ALSL_0659 [Aerosticca soli]|uniref:Uncharacterized protein n=1 Tax=Aerosticca soli TaxID=2010829 RepID=A0A2Z6E2N2_9GAMM|nr:hypothetical protein ALSL_0659 [Aerosticca soli]